jgi:hypothetical protein
MPAFYQRCGLAKQVVNIVYNNGTGFILSGGLVDFSIDLDIVLKYVMI